MPARSLEPDDELDTLSAATCDPPARAEPAPGAIQHPRFELLGALGRGAFGTVFAARDREREETVALKVLHRRSPASIQGFRREFRELAELTHPHLPLLYELFVAEDAHFFTMELVVGTSLGRWVRVETIDDAPGPSDLAPALDAPPTTWSASDLRPARSASSTSSAPLDLARLERCLGELESALGFLHARGLVHGDVKPSNVLVRRDGRLVLLDFGLVRRAGAPRDRFAGTPRYAAPEVGLAPPMPPEDVYAVGTLTFELVAGRPPFLGAGREVLDDKRRRDAPSLGALAPDAPASLVARVDRWLSREPAARGALCEGPPTSFPVFVGRAEELARLASELDRVRPERGRAILVVGAAGLGKSALLGAFAARVGGRAEVLQTRATGRERLAYAAIAPLIELLDAREVAAAPSHAALARAIAARLTALARDRPACVLVDDLHFAGPDAVAVLSLLLQPPWLPGVLFVLASRPAEPEAVALRLPLPIDAMELRPLPDEAADELVRTLVVAPPLRTELGRRALGHPYFLTELAHHPASTAATLAGLLDQRVQELDPTARACLEAVCVTSGAATPRLLCVLLPDLRGRASETLERLVRARLLRGREETTGFVPAHDLVRERVLDLLGDRARSVRERWCGVLDPDAPGDREALLEHLLVLDRGEEAAELAERAAEGASAAQALARAAELVALALRARHEPARRRALLERYVSLCERAQRGADAIGALDELASAAAAPAERARLATRAAYHALCAGRVEEGHRRLRAELAAHGLAWPASSFETLARVALCELGLVRPPPVARGPGARVALDLLADASNALAMIDNPRARVLKAEAVAIARLVAEPMERAEHLLRDAFYLTSFGARSRRRLAQRLDEVDQLVGPTPPPRIAALREAVVAIASFQAGDGAAACRALARAESAVAATTTPTDNSAVVLRIIQGHALRLQGALPELRAHVDRVLADAEERGNTFLRFTALFGGHVTWLAAGAPEVSRHRLTTLRWPSEGGAFHVQHWLRAEAEIETSLYEGDARGGVRRLGRTITHLLTSTLRVLESVRISSDAAVGRLLLAAWAEAAASGGELPLRERALLALVTRRLAASAAPQARLRSALLEAGNASIRGAAGRAVVSLRQARALAGRLEHRLLEALAILRLGALGAATEHDLTTAHATLARLGVACPHRFADVEIPGFARGRDGAGAP